MIIATLTNLSHLHSLLTYRRLCPLPGTSSPTNELGCESSSLLVGLGEWTRPSLSLSYSRWSSHRQLSDRNMPGGPLQESQQVQSSLQLCVTAVHTDLVHPFVTSNHSRAIHCKGSTSKEYSNATNPATRPRIKTKLARSLHAGLAGWTTSTPESRPELLLIYDDNSRTGELTPASHALLDALRTNAADVEA